MEQTRYGAKESVNSQYVSFVVEERVMKFWGKEEDVVDN
jgi:hypothetical protein